MFSKSSGKDKKFLDDWKIDRVLGQGAYACVYEITQRKTNRVDAVKMIVSKSPSERKVALQEAQVWKQVGEHENIVKLHEIFDEHDRLYLVMEKCECHVLERLSKGFRMQDVALLFRQMLASIAYLHSHSVVHRDIKPENYLCMGQDFHCVKLCDFGFATAAPRGVQLKGVFGTPPFISPEMVGGRHDRKTDVWSLGVCCYFILSRGIFPYKPVLRTSAAMKKAISEGGAISVEEEDLKHAPLLARHFAVTLLERSAARRMTADEAQEHAFLQTSDRTLLRGKSAISDSSTVASEKDFEERERGSAVGKHVFSL